jgi:hypothetical protein
MKSIISIVLRYELRQRIATDSCVNHIPEGLLGIRCRVAEVTCAYNPQDVS